MDLHNNLYMQSWFLMMYSTDFGEPQTANRSELQIV